ncbi:putative hydrolase (beta-lactamase-like) [Actinoplanes sp. NBRC 14428]|uniref:Glyoxylase-like metal-dependent hydrolase (Beta-lactamase superfamily II) n=1 Tax=Pseudosporangium ferrugineum TaxID=439699 RepID=A0A2T0S6L5_9ACTN|nr:MBL fold metallo-hydrolase [Pseudosporangium ferrugineum]PRY28933.1 glyoxylase-like metal-dependent hydrolase (beta-lactamase superfamily II) [Pseudosporangium ferrugineum]BCJ53602.1 putative hydrolase (beta-lactamase-like) [Actinoplanes sp. NBRC 14428]
MRWGVASVSSQVERLPEWVTLLRAPNPGPMTLDGTNTWLLRAPGAADTVVIDPGPDDAGHLASVAENRPLSAILVTHGHHDHVEGAETLSRMLGGVPVLAADPKHGDPMPPRMRLAGLDIEVVATPGHTADSVSFVVEDAVFTGDTILGRGTTVVAWPDGDLGAYLASLAALTAYPMLMLPGHGPVRADCAELATAYLAHRRERLDQVRAALAGGAGTPEAIVDVVYPDIDPGVRFAAEWSARAQLEYLRRESHRPPEQLDPL